MEDSVSYVSNGVCTTYVCVCVGVCGVNGKGVPGREQCRSLGGRKEGRRVGGRGGIQQTTRYNIATADKQGSRITHKKEIE